jgi:hypothetical protein
MNFCLKMRVPMEVCAFSLEACVKRPLKRASEGYASELVGIGFFGAEARFQKLSRASEGASRTHLLGSSFRASKRGGWGEASGNPASRFIERIQHIRQQVQDILQKSNAKYKQRHDQHRVPHKFKVSDKVWLHLQKERLTGPHRKLRPLPYGDYTITKVVGDNSFELNIPPFLGLHPVFNVDLLRPYFPPLVDTSEIVEQLTPTELNLDCMQQESNDQIVDT